MIKSEVKDVRISCLLIFFKNSAAIILSKSLNQPLVIKDTVPRKLVISLVFSKKTFVFDLLAMITYIRQTSIVIALTNVSCRNKRFI